ncbi:serine hydrolase [Massilia sp. Leaf139]|uniref:serine hydrolase domain-containing protein n=1 Tax=Massilia sp. Leaf139 TaxID=1736272 RepID=UPI0009EB6507|nr:serine hydrolase domain-containing protein [Massilia sp. Leaf139]
MHITRRNLLAATTLAPFISSCAVTPPHSRADTVDALAGTLGIDAAYATLSAAEAASPVAVSPRSSMHPVHPDSLFQAASLTKPLVAFVALTLARAGKLDLHAPVSQYLPDGYRHRQHPIARDADVDLVEADTLARIPVASLLNHTSGLPNWTSSALRPESAAGEKWRYSGEAYVLLQAVIGAVTGLDTQACLQRYAFDPLGMRHSRMCLTDEVRGRLAVGASLLPWDRPLDFVEPNAAASLYTSAGDYAKLVAHWLRDDALLALTLSQPVPVDPGLGLSWGYGWGVEQAAGGPYLWHWGNNPGYRAFVMVSASSGNGFVLFTSDARGLALAQPLARSTIPAEHRVFDFHMLA